MSYKKLLFHAITVHSYKNKKFEYLKTPPCYHVRQRFFEMWNSLRQMHPQQQWLTPWCILYQYRKLLAFALPLTIRSDLTEIVPTLKTIQL